MKESSKVFPIGLNRGHYWIKRDYIVKEITFNNRTFFSKYERIDAPLNDELIHLHTQHKITLAHSPILPNEMVKNIVIDYNGSEKERFLHYAMQVFIDLQIENWAFFDSKTAGHLHIYLQYAPMALQDAVQLGKIISNKLEQKMMKHWRIYPNDNLPEDYNILNLPYLYQVTDEGLSNG